MVDTPTRSTRKKKVNYAHLFVDENGAGPSRLPGANSDSSLSDFQQDEEDESEEDNDMDVDEEDDDEPSDGHESDVLPPPPPPAKSTKKKTTANSAPKSPIKTPRVPKQIPKLPVAPPTPSAPRPPASAKKAKPGPRTDFDDEDEVDKSLLLHVSHDAHRYRPPPLFTRPGLTERLVNAPNNVFEPTELATTNCYTAEPWISHRLAKSWGQNVGAGPLWELTEDRSWFKESDMSAEQNHTEAARRPRVYKDLPIPNTWRVLNAQEAQPYTENVSAVTCNFISKDVDTRRTLLPLTSLPPLEHMQIQKTRVFNAGGPVWGLDWCPIHPSDRAARNFNQYLAVSTFPDIQYAFNIGEKLPRPTAGSIQIWELSEDDMECVMVLGVDCGNALELRWCPLPSHDLRTEDRQEEGKLGLLGGVFEDGTFSLFIVPDPATVSHKGKETLVVKLTEPLVRIEVPGTSVISVGWANSELIALGCSNGWLAVYDIKDSILSGSPPKVLYFANTHQSAIRSVNWMQIPPVDGDGEFVTDADPFLILSGGYDGITHITNLIDGEKYSLNRSRDVIMTVVFNIYAGGINTTEGDNFFKIYSLTGGVYGKGQLTFDLDGSIWDIALSTCHPMTVLAGADGVVASGNSLKSPNRNGTMPALVHTVFRIDYNRKTGDYRMLDNLAASLARTDKKQRPSKSPLANAAEKEKTDMTGTWPVETAVHRAVWNTCNGLASAGMLVSGTASGLCRIDTLCGHWVKKKMPLPIDALRAREKMEGDNEEDDA